jgi:hypothetical protein
LSNGGIGYVTQQKVYSELVLLMKYDINLIQSSTSNSRKNKMTDMMDLCNALSQLCCELCLQFLHSIGGFRRYFRRGSDTNDNLDFELELSSSRNDRSGLELDLSISHPRPVHEPAIQQSITEGSIATCESQQLRGRLAPIDEENEEEVLYVTDGSYGRVTADDSNRSTVTLTSSTKLPTPLGARLEPLESDQSSMQELHFDLASRPSSCGLM